MIKKPEYRPHSITYKRIFLLEGLPAPLVRTDEHWQIFDDYTAWPEFRMRQIRVPQTKEWFRAREEIIVSESEAGFKEETSRTLLPGDADIHAVHPDKEIRKNRYFYELSGTELAVDVFLGNLWGLILAQAELTNEQEAGSFSTPEFSVTDVSGSGFFRGENLVQTSFAEVTAEFSRLKS